LLFAASPSDSNFMNTLRLSSSSLSSSSFSSSPFLFFSLIFFFPFSFSFFLSSFFSPLSHPPHYHHPVMGARTWVQGQGLTFKAEAKDEHQGQELEHQGQGLILGGDSSGYF